MLDNSFIIGYIILVLLIGYFSGRRQTGADFMLADRKLGLFDFVGTTVASAVGGGFLVVYTAYVYEFGIGALSAVLGLSLGYISFAFIAKKLRRLAHENDFHTVADYFHFHFDKKTGHFIAFTVGFLFLLFLLNQFIAGTQILSAISGYSYELSLLISASVVLLYLVLGGFRSVVKTDVFQYLILIFLVLVVGFSMVFEAKVPAIEFTKSSMDLPLLISFVVYGLLAVWHSADLWQRIYAAKNDKVIKQGMIISGLLLFVIGFGITMIAFSARIAFPGIDPAQAFVFGLQNLLSPGMLALGIILVFAAIMSSADTIIFVLATNFAKDLMPHVKGRRLLADELRGYTRLGIILIILITTMLAFFFRNLVDIALIVAGIGMSLTPPIIASFIWRLKPGSIVISIVLGLLYLLGWIISGKITPETMISSVLISAIALFVFQKILRK